VDAHREPAAHGLRMSLGYIDESTLARHRPVPSAMARPAISMSDVRIVVAWQQYFRHVSARVCASCWHKPAHKTQACVSADELRLPQPQRRQAAWAPSGQWSRMIARMRGRLSAGDVRFDARSQVRRAVWNGRWLGLLGLVVSGRGERGRRSRLPGGLHGIRTDLALPNDVKLVN